MSSVYWPNSTKITFSSHTTCQNANTPVLTQGSYPYKWNCLLLYHVSPFPSSFLRLLRRILSIRIQGILILKKLFYSSVFLRAYDLDEGFSRETEAIQPTSNAAKNGCQDLDWVFEISLSQGSMENLITIGYTFSAIEVWIFSVLVKTCLLSHWNSTWFWGLIFMLAFILEHPPPQQDLLESPGYSYNHNYLCSLFKPRASKTFLKHCTIIQIMENHQFLKCSNGSDLGWQGLRMIRTICYFSVFPILFIVSFIQLIARSSRT